MKKKIIVMFLFCLFAFVLTACGATVHTETSFLKDGSGKRIVYLDISRDDESKINGGFEELDRVFKNSAPDCVTVNRHEKEQDGVMRYEFVYDFKNIDDFKAKTREITGKDSDIVWDNKEDIFDGTIHYSETVNTSDYIEWALVAAKEQNIANYSVSDLYEEEENVTLFEGESVHVGQGRAEFTINNAPMVEKVSVFTSYSVPDGVKKEIQLSFSYEDFKTMNLEKGLEYLSRFSKNFKVNSNCNGYSVLLNGQKELKSFLKKASNTVDYSEIPVDGISSKKDSNYYVSGELKDTIFYQIADLTEVYNLNNLLSGFRLATDVIENYLDVPKSIPYDESNIHHTYAREATEFYQYIGAYPIADTYYMHFSGSDSVAMKDLQVQFQVADDFDVEQMVSIQFRKNGKKISSSLVSDYYKERAEKIQYVEDGDNVTVTFIKSFPYKKEYKAEDMFPVLMKKSDVFNLSKTGYDLSVSFDITDYLDYVEIPVVYKIMVPGSLKVESGEYNGEKLKRAEIKNGWSGDVWTYSRSVEGTNPIKAEISLSQVNVLFYGILILVLLLMIGGVIMFYFQWKKSKKGK